MDIDESEEIVALMREGKLPIDDQIIGELSRKLQERKDEFESDFLSLIKISNTLPQPSTRDESSSTGISYL